MCLAPGFTAGTGGAGTQGAGFLTAMLFPLLENYCSSVLLLGKLSQVKIAHSRSEGQSSRTCDADQQIIQS